MSAGHAVIGCGRVAPNHADGVRAANGTLLWACDNDPLAAKSFAADHDIPRWSADAAEVLAEPQVTTVSIAVDHAQHARLAEAALRAGKHVLVEKPLALSVAQATDLAELADRTGLVLSVVSQHRYDPLVVAVRRWQDDGLFGELVSARVALEANREPAYYADSYWRGTLAGEGGSALINQGYHCLDVTRMLVGDLRVRAAVTSSAVLGTVIETEDTLSALLLAGSAPVSFDVTVAAATLWRTRIDLVGTAGAVTFDLDHPGTLHRATGRALEKAAAALPGTDTAQPVAGKSYYGMSHRRQIADFLAAAEGGSPMRTGPQDGVAMVSLLRALYASANGGAERGVTA